MTKNIQLTKDKISLVDDEDYEWLNQWKWYFSSDGYVKRGIYKNRKMNTVSMHQTIMNTPRGMNTDHINHNKLDNRRSNLRICTPSQNSENSKHRANNTSGVKGVGWVRFRNKWVAYIGYQRKLIQIGYFDNLTDAINARKNKEIELFGEYKYDHQQAIEILEALKDES